MLAHPPSSVLRPSSSSQPPTLSFFLRRVGDIRTFSSRGTGITEHRPAAEHREGEQKRQHRPIPSANDGRPHEDVSDPLTGGSPGLRGARGRPGLVKVKYSASRVTSSIHVPPRVRPTRANVTLGRDEAAPKLRQDYLYGQISLAITFNFSSSTTHYLC